MLTLSWDKETGLLSYTHDEEKKLRGDAKLVAQMIDDKSIRVNMMAWNKEETSTGNLMIGGAFMGTDVTKDANGNVTQVVAKQEVNPGVLGRADAPNAPGQMAMHEFSESYQAGRLSKKSGESSPRAGLDGSVYEEAHNSATPQREVHPDIYDKEGKKLQMLPDGSYPSGVNFVEWYVINNGTKRIIQTLPSTILK